MARIPRIDCRRICGWVLASCGYRLISNQRGYANGVRMSETSSGIPDQDAANGAAASGDSLACAPVARYGNASRDWMNYFDGIPMPPRSRPREEPVPSGRAPSVVRTDESAIIARPTGGTGPLRRWTWPWLKRLVYSGIASAEFRSTARVRVERAVRNRDPRLLFSGTSAARLRRRQPPPGVEVIRIRRPFRLSGDYSRAVDPYQAWLDVNGLNSRSIRDLQGCLELRTGRLPRISVITPVYNTPRALLEAAVNSVIDQVYPNWELVLVDDCSPGADVIATLRELEKLDTRIKVEFADRNCGISGATNRAVDLATGEIIVFLDHDDLLTADCLAEIAIHYADHPKADVVYSDDDKITMDGERFAPQFKPDFSPTYLLSQMYFGHVFSVRRSLYLELGGFRREFDGSQDFDFALRATEHAREVGHIPKVLYNWRVAPGSTAAGGDAKPEAFEAGRRAVQQALDRRGVSGVAVQPGWASKANCGVYTIEFPESGPSITLIIPTYNGLDLLKRCIRSLSVTAYDNFKVLVVDNDSNDEATLEYLSALDGQGNIRVAKISNDGKPFSYARVNNIAARFCETDYVLFLNNDTEVISPDWLSKMVGHAQMDGVGAVGAKLLFEDRTVQHCGIVHGFYNGMAGPAYRNMPEYEWGLGASARVAREFSAVTAACLLMSRNLFLDLGGFDETRFNVAYNDVDLCYRIVDAGLRCVCVPDALLFHYEGKTRGSNDNPKEIAAFRELYRTRRDPYYSPNLSLDSERFEISGRCHPRRDRRPVRALMVSHNFEHEGAPNSMFEMVRGLTERGILAPVVMSPSDGPIRSHYERAGIEVLIAPNPIADVYSAAHYDTNRDALAEMVTRQGFEAVYGNTLQTFWAISAAARAGVPAVWNPRESEPWDAYFNYLPEELRSYAYDGFRTAYSVVFVANATREGWQPVNTRNNFRVIPNGISLERLASRSGGWDRIRAREELGVDANESVVVLVGTVCDRKGQIDLVEAVPHLKSDRRVRIFIVGDRPGPYSEALHAGLRRLPPSRHDVEIIPETGDPYIYFRAADVAVCTSRIESYPRIILEAMACGLPIVTTPVFGIPEQVRLDVNALFYTPGRPRELAAGLNKLLSDETLRLSFAAMSPHVIRSLTSYTEMLDAYAGVFREAAIASTRGAAY